MCGLKFPPIFIPKSLEKPDEKSTGTRFTKELCSILARFLLVINVKLKASFIWASYNLIFEARSVSRGTQRRKVNRTRGARPEQMFSKLASN